MSVLVVQTDSPVGVTPALSAEQFRKLRQRMMLDFCKWDSQIGDQCCLAPFALTIGPRLWQRLATWAEGLYRETLAAEVELLDRPELWPALGVPRRLRKVLGRWRRDGLAPSAGRVMRFDFHLAKTGWRITEVNSDVPGGYCESTHLPQLMAEALAAGHKPLGDPARAWAQAIARAAGCGHVALVSAPGLIDDRQIMAYMAARLAEEGCTAALTELRQLQWSGGSAHVGGQRVDAIVRFYQAEWLANLRRGTGWPLLFASGHVPVTNPPAAALAESKGFPLVWDRLRTPLKLWRELLPETQALSSVDWRHDAHWVLKEKFSNNGDAVILADKCTPQVWRRVRRAATWFPGRWVAQERFENQVLPTPLGAMQMCLGVYVVEGRVAGVYGRLTPGAVVDFTAMEVAVLLEGADE